MLQGASLLEAISFSNTQKIAQKRFWHILLHYIWTSDGFVSEADGVPFFIAPNGKINPKAELIASLKEIYRTDLKAGKSFQCRFPARYLWIKDQFKLKNRDQICPELNRWRKTLAPDGITLIFSAAYLNNPASMFGHTFLRLDKKFGTKTVPLLSYIVNYAANPTTNNPILYSLYGVFGGFRGRFATIPYYLKVKEYAAMEMRDLWEYELDISKERSGWVLLHMWELGKTHFDYYYARENCSYHILSLLEIAKPELNFRPIFQGYTAPGDTLRYLLKQKNLIRKITFRPSVRRELEGFYDLLTDDERDLIVSLWDNFEKGAKKLKKYTPKRRGLILDTYQRYYRFKKGYALSETEEQKLHQQEQIFQGLRSKITVNIDIPNLKEPTPPHQGHLSSMSGVGFEYRTQFQEHLFIPMVFRPVLHDLMGDDRGYGAGAAIEMLQLYTTIMVDRADIKWLFNGFDLVKIKSIAPYHSWTNTFSWNLTTGIYPIEDGIDPEKQWNDLYFTLGGGPGFALAFFEGFKWYLFGNIHLDGGSFQDYYRMRVSGRTGFDFKPFYQWGFGAHYSYEIPILGEEFDFYRHNLSIYTRFSMSERLDLLFQYRYQIKTDHFNLDHRGGMMIRQYF